VLSVEPSDILLMSGITTSDEIWSKVTGIAKIIRDGLTDIGVDHFSRTVVSNVAPVLGLPATKLWDLIEGRDHANIAECLKIAKFATVNVRTVLKASGVTPGDALALAKAARCQQHRHRDHNLSDLLRSYRIAAELRQGEVAKMLKFDRTTLAHCEAGRHPFPLDRLVTFAKLTNAPLERLLSAAIAA
jgi:DNA-binding XRE family transcriptional regulator